ncbi:MAG: alkaline phosphatase family protein [Chitinophagaceae bacterium]
MKKFIIVVCCTFTLTAFSQKQKTENLIIFTLDGMRWEEIYGGVDSAILHNPQFTHDREETEKMLWDNSAEERRKRLYPFIWNTIAQHGQLYGNRHKGSFADVANPYRFSYPGYNEIFTGYPDTAVNSNDKIKNKNENVLEFINSQKGYEGKVAAFSTWDVIPYILNKFRNGLVANTYPDTLDLGTEQSKLVNSLQFFAAKEHGDATRPDLVTYMAAREYFKTKKPKVLYISFDESDEFAHAGKYNDYLGVSHMEDAMMADLWNLVQSMPEYKDKTTLIVTCDHGRGDKIKSQWRDHGQKVDDATQIWMGVMGPDTKPLGENTPGQVYQKQFAATMAALLGFKFKPNHPAGEPIPGVYR